MEAMSLSHVSCIKCCALKEQGPLHASFCAHEQTLCRSSAVSSTQCPSCEISGCTHYLFFCSLTRETQRGTANTVTNPGAESAG